LRKAAIQGGFFRSVPDQSSINPCASQGFTAFGVQVELSGVSPRSFANKGDVPMSTKLTILTAAYLVVGSFLLAFSYQPGGTTATPKTDRVAVSTFLMERFAG
jgi:hypothetical protein